MRIGSKCIMGFTKMPLLILKGKTVLARWWFLARSRGLPSSRSYRTWEKQSRPGAGPIPRCDRVGLDHYTVSTKPINLKHVRGVEGNFYKINPYLVKVDGVQRGDFGIHRDANVPGSAGCVVIRNDHAWADFEKMMSHYQAAGVQEVALIVSYARWVWLLR